LLLFVALAATFSSYAFKTVKGDNMNGFFYIGGIMFRLLQVVSILAVAKKATNFFNNLFKLYKA
jgi:hypothetical protein